MEVSKQYDDGEMAQDYASGSEQNESIDLGRKFLREEVTKTPKESVLLDVGCGNGLDLLAFNEMGFSHLYGVDPSEKFIDEARERLPDVHLEVGTFESLPFEDAYFDVITSRHAVHYSKDLSVSLKEVARVLKTGGKFIVVMSHPLADSLLEKDDQGNISVTLFKGGVTITYPQHGLDEIFSSTFSELFEIETKYEYIGNERDQDTGTIPNALAFVAVRK